MTSIFEGEARSDSPLILPSLPPVIGAVAKLTRDDIKMIICEWQKRMQLDHWEIEFSNDPPPEDETDLGSIKRHDPYDYATLHINPEFPSWTRRMVNLVVVHELMHLHTRDLECAAESVESALSHQASGLWKSRFLHEDEALVDKMATLLVNLGGVV